MSLHMYSLHDSSLLVHCTLPVHTSKKRQTTTGACLDLLPVAALLRSTYRLISGQEKCLFNSHVYDYVIQAGTTAFHTLHLSLIPPVITVLVDVTFPT